MWCKELNDALFLYPDQFRCSSGKKVWWNCDKTCDINCKHRWQVSINNIHNSRSCPYCCSPQHRVCCVKKSAAANPILYHSFDRDHPENAGINLELLIPFTAQAVWWICFNNCDTNCHHSWKASIVNRQRGRNCPFCTSESAVPCCVKKSLGSSEYSETVKDFDYELYHPRTPSDYFPQASTKLLWKCHICNFGWVESIGHKVKCLSGGCAKHRSISNGEFKAKRVLNEMNIPFLYQFKLIQTRPYDFQFVYKNNQYLFEFDGIQHFMTWRSESKNDFTARQQRDIDKTNAAISENYFIIRIDYTHINRIKECLLDAFECQKQGAKFYLSSPDMYSYLNLIKE